MTKTIKMNVTGPKTVLRNINHNKISLITYWGQDPTPSPINIWKTKDGFTYQDVDANFVRNFRDADFLRWEFEYPQELVDFLNKLPIGSCNVNQHIGFTNEERKALDVKINGYDTIEALVNQIKSKKGSNITKPKKKRKKNKKTHRK